MYRNLHRYIRAARAPYNGLRPTAEESPAINRAAHPHKNPQTFVRGFFQNRSGGKSKVLGDKIFLFIPYILYAY